MRRGELWWADLGIPSSESSPGFERLVLIVQDDTFNLTLPKLKPRDSCFNVSSLSREVLQLVLDLP